MVGAVAPHTEHTFDHLHLGLPWEMASRQCRERYGLVSKAPCIDSEKGHFAPCEG